MRRNRTARRQPGPTGNGRDIDRRYETCHLGGDTSQILQLDTEEGREGRNARMEGEEGNEEDKIAFHFYPIIYRARKEEKRKSERRDSFFLSEINFDREEKRKGALVVRSVAIVNVGAGRDIARERPHFSLF